MSRIVEDWITGYQQFTENSESPDLYKEWVAVSVVASCLQRKVFLTWDSPTYPNMYIVLVGPSGKSRKGTAMSPGLEMLQELGTINLAAESITREALIRELKQSSGTEITEDSVKSHCSLTIYSPELTVFLGYNNQQLMVDLGDWYDCRSRWTYRTKGSGVDEIIGVWVNLIGATTPELLRESMPSIAIGGGLASRMIFVYQEKKSKNIALPFLKKEDLLLRHNLMLDLDRIRMMNGEFTYSQNFLDLWVPFYNHQEDNLPFKDQKFSAYFSRRAKHILKLCMILSASGGDDMMITARIFERAKDLLERTEVFMPQTFAGFGESDQSAVLVRVMAVLGVRKQIPYNELIEMFFEDATQETMEAIVRTIEHMKWGKMHRTAEGVGTLHYTKEE